MIRCDLTAGHVRAYPARNLVVSESGLELALAYIEEAITLYRGLGLQGDLASSLGVATQVYRALAEAANDDAGRQCMLKSSLRSVREAVTAFRKAGIVRYLLHTLRDNGVSSRRLRWSKWLRLGYAASATTRNSAPRSRQDA